jgi:hypothetical protein
MAALGILVLTLSVAEWGVAWDGAPLRDPAYSETTWDGPPDITQGKHLMSYALGGIGLAHLDTEHAVRFLNAVAEKIPESSADLQSFTRGPHGFRYDLVRAEGGLCPPQAASAVIMTDLNGEEFRHAAAHYGGEDYCHRFNPAGQVDVQRWRKLRHWCRVALRRQDMQEWVLKYWLNTFWIPSYNEVIGRPQGTVQEALVVARMWSSAPGEAQAALNAAGAEADRTKRIKIELRDYGNRSRTNDRRAKHVMPRPVIAYDLSARP